jgi:threonine dehydrogenase-like Zn-dependent dehydrogenase
MADEMQAVRFFGNRTAKVVTMPRPHANNANVVIKVKASVLCGSDWPYYDASTDILGCVPGHEVAGQVVDVDKATYVKPGDRVLLNTQVGCGRCEHCRGGQVLFCEQMKVYGGSPGNHGGHAEYMLIPEKDCLSLPDDISYEVGALIPDGLGVAHHSGMVKLGVVAKDTVGVFGAGPVGLGVTLCMKWFGAKVIVSDIVDYRLSLAKEFGADYTLNPQKEDVVEVIRGLTHGKGVDKAFDCASFTDGSTNDALHSVKKGGKIAFIGQKPTVTIRDFESMIILRELQIMASCGYNLSEYGKLVSLIEDGYPLHKLMTHRFSLKQVPEAYQTFREGNTGKVAIIQE